MDGKRRDLPSPGRSIGPATSSRQTLKVPSILCYEPKEDELRALSTILEKYNTLFIEKTRGYAKSTVK